MSSNFANAAINRLDTIGTILAAGLVRILARQSSSKSSHARESSLSNSPHQSGHPASRNVENPDD